MNEHMIPLVMFLAMNAIIWIVCWIKYNMEERRKDEQVFNQKD